MSEMKHVAETDQKTMANLLDEALMTRSAEALSLALETAYCLGRRTGFGECGDMTKAALAIAPTERPGLSESVTGPGGNGHG